MAVLVSKIEAVGEEHASIEGSGYEVGQAVCSLHAA